jgi:hypothetical protein
MLRCKHKAEQRDFISTDSVWREGGCDELRRLSTQRLLICPRCKQDVVLRAGPIRIWHFAHRDLGECPLHGESEDLLRARDLLYNCLRSAYTHLGAEVIVEDHSIEQLPRAIDCLVRTPDGTTCAFWISETAMRKGRSELIAQLDEAVTDTRFLLLKRVIKHDKDDANCLHLSPSERDFARHTDYDNLYSKRGGQTLQYIDPEEAEIVTFRGVDGPLHSLQTYKPATRLSTRMSGVEVDTTRNELTYPGEMELADDKYTSRVTTIRLPH